MPEAKPLGAQQLDLFEDLSPSVVPDVDGVGNLHVPLAAARPLILNFGGGVDSSALACKLREAEIVPDLVIFSDTGNERPETYAWIAHFSQAMRSWGWPAVEIVRYAPVRAPYFTLFENCIVNKTVPSLAFGAGGCSLKFKGDVMDAFLVGISRGPNAHPPWPLAAAAWAAGVKPTKLIGYDAGPKDSRRKVNTHECEWFYYRYPLREEWSLDRDACIATIQRHGFPPPPKSSCTFCPAMREEEVWAMLAVHPVLYLLAMWMEGLALPGLDGIEGLWRRTRKGDGRPGSWIAWAERFVQPPAITTRWRTVTKSFRPKEPPRTYQELEFVELTPAGAAYARLGPGEAWQAAVTACDEVRRIEARRGW